MNDVIQAAAELQAVCQSHDWQFCFIGGLALQRWSAPRETVDVDLSLFAEQLQPLAELKETPEILDQLEARRVEFEP